MMAIINKKQKIYRVFIGFIVVYFQCESYINKNTGCSHKSHLAIIASFFSLIIGHPKNPLSNMKIRIN